MRWLIVAFAVLGCRMAAGATYVYVSMAPEQKIQIYELDSASGELKAIDTFAVDAAPGSLTTDPKRRFLYASLRSNSSIGSYRIDGPTGKLTPMNAVSLPTNENAAFVATDRTGRWLLSASYNGGTVVVHRIRDDGAIESPAVQTVKTAKTAHCVAVSRSNTQVFIPHVTPNAVFQFQFEAVTGQLTDAGQAAGGQEKAGPRHLAFHPKLDLAFTSDESGSSITAYRLDQKSGLTPVQTLSTLPPGFTGKNSTAEVKVHSSGKFVWVSNRGHDSLAGFAIDASGGLKAIGQTPTEATPRSFEIDPAGKFVFGAGEGSGKLAVFRVNDATGQLDRIQTYPVGKSLTWVMAVAID
jgi:6-phosphogluconolactonase